MNIGDKQRVRLISIHAPRGRGDIAAKMGPKYTVDFNPRPSREGRLRDAGHHSHRALISIHAPRGRGDNIIRHSHLPTV